MTKFLAKIVAWITDGYPEGVPGPDRVPLLALLSVASPTTRSRPWRGTLKDVGEMRGIDPVDIGVLITQITDELPTPDDVERVRERLAAKGWPLDERRDPEESP